MRRHPLKTWRTERGLSLAKAGRMAGVTAEAWRKWEGGKYPTFPHLRTLVKLTGLRADQLYTGMSNVA